ncbi:MAG: aldehyde dehydrogenase (NAD+), partial [Nonlabens sp.]
MDARLINFAVETTFFIQTPKFSMNTSIADIQKVLKNLGIESSNPGAAIGGKWLPTRGAMITSFSPVDGKAIAEVRMADAEDYDKVVKAAEEAFLTWKMVPAPQRGEIVRQIGLELRKYKDDLGNLVSYEMGKSLQEGLGEVQEMIDICDFAVGLSRQLYGLTMHSERPLHRMYEQ